MTSPIPHTDISARDMLFPALYIFKMSVMEMEAGQPDELTMIDNRNYGNHNRYITVALGKSYPDLHFVLRRSCRPTAPVLWISIESSPS